MDHEHKAILVVVNDIFFYTKIRDALLPEGYKLERARSQPEVAEKAAALRPAALIMNMNDDTVNAFQALEQVKGLDGSRRIPVLAFANHEEADTFRRAKELGVTKIVSRNEFSSRTRELLKEVMSADETFPSS